MGCINFTLSKKHHKSSQSSFSASCQQHIHGRVSAHTQASQIKPVLLLCCLSTAHSWYGVCAHSSITNQASPPSLPLVNSTFMVWCLRTLKHHKSSLFCFFKQIKPRLLPSLPPPALSICMHVISHMDEKRLSLRPVDHSLASVHVSTDYAVI